MIRGMVLNYYERLALLYDVSGPSAGELSEP
ncbi:hypothetical protein AVDCRST_MAG81-3000 [uncultured Synechococcales cyanobacterium]|uniref:Uncharacterized protein n=1 Tax=uncultured Synechococcales cyanobacterium TaxID=1936017 RepID=A0A6J4VE01_9CYAN|nr:hypothetical protein AVDCRST_MAG81-3000 [uncultured Synechococcales cyanobacterium]